MTMDTDDAWLARISDRLGEIELSLLSYRGQPLDARRLEDWSADVAGLRRTLDSVLAVNPTPPAMPSPAVSEVPTNPVAAAAHRAGEQLAWQKPIYDRRRTAEPEAVSYAKELAISLHRKFYPEVTQWRVLEDLYGVLTQIDNMTTDLVRAPEPAPDSVVTRVRHVKTGGTYRVLDVDAHLQTSVPLTDMATVVVYQCEADKRLWVRREEEFGDGRFEPLPKPVRHDDEEPYRLKRDVCDCGHAPELCDAPGCEKCPHEDRTPAEHEEIIASRVRHDDAKGEAVAWQAGLSTRVDATKEGALLRAIHRGLPTSSVRPLYAAPPVPPSLDAFIKEEDRRYHDPAASPEYTVRGVLYRLAAANPILPAPEPSARMEPTMPMAKALYQHVSDLGIHGPEPKVWEQQTAEHRRMWLLALTAALRADTRQEQQS